MKVVIVGLGLIGGSICMGLADSGVATQIVGADSHRDAIDYFLTRGYLNARATSFADHADADLWVIAVPPSQVVGVIAQIAPHVKKDAVVTDCTSVKTSILEAVPNSIRPNFVGGHPMAGLAHSHYTLAKPTLFADARWILCAGPECTKSTLRRAETLAYSLDAIPVWMDADEHDRHVALLSHVPHAVAALLVQQASRLANPGIAGTSWTDLTRVAGNYPEMWKQIFSTNSDAIIEHIHSLREGLDSLENIMRAGNEDDLLQFFKDAEACKQPRHAPRNNSKLSAS